MPRQITLMELPKPKQPSLYGDIEWLGNSFGFYTGRDTERIASKVLHYLLDDISKEGHCSTEKTSNGLNIEVQRVNYHLRTFIESGFFCREKRMIVLRHGSVKAAVEEIRKDANRIFDELSIVAEEIDRGLNLKNR